MRILVTGGTGRLGRVLVPELRRRGHSTLVLSRSPRDEPNRLVGDLLTGAGLREALLGVDVVVHCASQVGGRDDVIAAETLIGAVREASAGILYASIVGIDTHPYSYYRIKREVEQLIEKSGVPFAIQRATQFHDFLEFGLNQLTLGPFALVPSDTFCQPVSTAAVANRLADAVESGMRGRLADIAGPLVQSADELMRVSLAARRSRARAVRVRVPGAAGAAYRRGEHLAGPDAILAGESFAEHVARQDRIRRSE